jgi:hypothetical protein
VANKISTKNHLPESFTILPAPEDRRPVQGNLQETLEPISIHKSQTWDDHVNSIVKAGSGEVQVSADWLLQQLGETGTLDFIRKYRAMIKIYNVSSTQVGNAMMAHNSRWLSNDITPVSNMSLSAGKHQEYIDRNPMIFKFANPNKEGGVTVRYGGMDWIQSDAVMADTGCDIMLITQAMALGIKLPIGESNIHVHTSLSGHSGVIGEITDTFDVIMSKGTVDELVIRVGHDTNIKVLVAPNNSIYVVLLCQKFHHACGGYNDPALNAFVYRPKLLSEGLLEPLVMLDGTTHHSRGNHWTSSHLVVLNVEDINPSPSLLDDGDVESHPGPSYDWVANEPNDLVPWLSWVHDKQFPRLGQMDGLIVFNRNLEQSNL